VAEIRGRPFAFVALTLSAWVGARMIVSTNGDSAIVELLLPAAALPLVLKKPETGVRIIALTNNSQRRCEKRPSRQVRRHKVSTNSDLPPAQDPWQDGGRPSGLSLLALVAGIDEPQSAGRDTPPSIALAFMGKAGPPEQKQPAQRSWGAQVYAYSFWRFSNRSGAALAPGGLYGGSQSGIIGTIDPFGAPDQGLSLLARASVTPDGDEREVALGFRWRPANNWPLTFTTERRFRADAPDRFAAYLAGGIDALPLIGKWSLDAFGQVGYVSGKGDSGFFDAQVRAKHPLTKISNIPLSAGFGTWAGGQADALRLDIGPSIGAKIDAGPTNLLIQLDWRMRAAGHAEPKNGLALTVSTSF
jgi:hypothetical protein